MESQATTDQSVMLTAVWRSHAGKGYDRDQAARTLRLQREKRLQEQRVQQDRKDEKVQKNNEDDGIVFQVNAEIEQIYLSETFRRAFEYFRQDMDHFENTANDIIDDRLERLEDQEEKLAVQKRQMEAGTLYLDDHDLYVFQDENGEYFNQEGAQLSHNETGDVRQALEKEPDTHIESYEDYARITGRYETVLEAKKQYLALKQELDELSDDKVELYEQYENGALSEAQLRERMSELEERQQDILDRMAPEDRRAYARARQDYIEEERAALADDQDGMSAADQDRLEALEREEEILNAYGREGAEPGAEAHVPDTSAFTAQDMAQLDGFDFSQAVTEPQDSAGDPVTAAHIDTGLRLKNIFKAAQDKDVKTTAPDNESLKHQDLENNGATDDAGRPDFRMPSGQSPDF